MHFIFFPYNDVCNAPAIGLIMSLKCLKFRGRWRMKSDCKRKNETGLPPMQHSLPRKANVCRFPPVRKNHEVLALPTDADVILSVGWHVSVLRGTGAHGSMVTPGLHLSSILKWPLLELFNHHSPCCLSIPESKDNCHIVSPFSIIN